MMGHAKPHGKTCRRNGSADGLFTCDSRVRFSATSLAIWLGLIAPALASAPEGLADFRAGRVMEAIGQWEEGAAKGDTLSLLYMASAYDQGAGVPQDFSIALDLYRRAAQRGNASAALNVGIMYDAGRGTPREAAEAVAWYRRAAELGSGRGAYDLGQMLEQGDGVARDKAGAIAAYRRALALGIPAAAQHLAALGVRPQPEPGVRAAPERDELAEAQRALQRSGLSSDQVTALSGRAASGDGSAAFDLGYAYEHGLGVKADPALALLWYGEAANHAQGRVRDYAEKAALRLRAQAKQDLR